ELEWHAEKRQQQVDCGANAPIEIGVDGTRRSDGLLILELKDRLLTCVEKLMNVPDHVQDWIPDKQVLHLIDPSLFPLMNERTRTTREPAMPPLEWIGQGNVMQEIPRSDHSYQGQSEGYLHSFQWLPTDFEVEADGKIRIRSYINNLHPEEHKDMYAVLEEIFEKLLPMFEDVLTEAREFHNRKHRFQMDKSVVTTTTTTTTTTNEPSPPPNSQQQPWIDWYDRRVLDPPHVRLNEFEPPQEYERYHLRPTPEPLSTASELSPYGTAVRAVVDAAVESVAVAVTVAKSPAEAPAEASAQAAAPAAAEAPAEAPVEAPAEAPCSTTTPTKTLQVFVRMVNIELTPEKPKHPGSSWRLEGIECENIVASGIYYYHLENMAESRLRFRIPVHLAEHERRDHPRCKLLYGLESRQALVQFLDGIPIKQDRCIVYPNTYYHQIPSFELADATRSGACRMLMFFLVNPQKPALSTTHVPPQQKEWARPCGTRLAAMERLPPEIMMEIERMVDWPMDLEEAKKIRHDVVRERTFLTMFEQYPFGQSFAFL
ncbi:hypothetical protein BGX31_003763, partial [Mortierella sp. GBA43]